MIEEKENTENINFTNKLNYFAEEVYCFAIITNIMAFLKKSLKKLFGFAVCTYNHLCFPTASQCSQRELDDVFCCLCFTLLR